MEPENITITGATGLYDEQEDYSDLEFETTTSHGKESELSQYIHCSKNEENRSHDGFIRYQDFTLNDIPAPWRTTQMYNAVRRVAQKTVLLTIGHISSYRPPPKKNVDIRGIDIITTGTGSANIDKELLKKPNQPCPFTNCSLKSGPHEVTPYFNVLTATHVVFDNMEVKKTYVDFFYTTKDDYNNGKVVRAQAVRLLQSRRKMDICLLECVSHDLKLFEKVLDVPPSVPNHSADGDQKPNQISPLKRIKSQYLAFIVSHPHGCEKQVSFGTVVGVKRTFGQDIPVGKKVQTLLDQMKEYTPNWREAGGMLGGKFFVTPETIENLEKRVKENPDYTLMDEPKVADDVNFYNFTYTTSSCPGSSGAPVCITKLSDLEKLGEDDDLRITNHLNKYDTETNLSGVILKTESFEELQNMTALVGNQAYVTLKQLRQLKRESEKNDPEIYAESISRLFEDVSEDAERMERQSLHRQMVEQFFIVRQFAYQYQQ